MKIRCSPKALDFPWSPGKNRRGGVERVVRCGRYSKARSRAGGLG